MFKKENIRVINTEYVKHWNQNDTNLFTFRLIPKKPDINKKQSTGNRTNDSKSNFWYVPNVFGKLMI
jgi:hypothetical protein